MWVVFRIQNGPHPVQRSQNGFILVRSGFCTWGQALGFGWPRLGFVNLRTKMHPQCAQNKVLRGIGLDLVQIRRLSCRDLPQCLLKHLGRLATGDQVPVVDDDGGHRVDTLAGIELLAFAHIVGIGIGFQNGPRLHRV